LAGTVVQRPTDIVRAAKAEIKRNDSKHWNCKVYIKCDPPDRPLNGRHRIAVGVNKAGIRSGGSKEFVVSIGFDHLPVVRHENAVCIPNRG
jgi:hypothetical protein